MLYERAQGMIARADKRLAEHFQVADPTASTTFRLLKEYRSCVRGAAIDVRSCGLLQFIVFLDSKVKEASVHGLLRDDLMDWLAGHSPLTSAMFPPADQIPPANEPLASYLTEKFSTHDLAVLTFECIEYLHLLSRLIEGRYLPLKSIHEKAPSETGPGGEESTA